MLIGRPSACEETPGFDMIFTHLSDNTDASLVEVTGGSGPFGLPIDMTLLLELTVQQDCEGRIQSETKAYHLRDLLKSYYHPPPTHTNATHTHTPKKYISSISTRKSKLFLHFASIMQMQNLKLR